MKLIINSDDFGFSKGINRGIITAYNEGLISTTTIMITMEDAEDAISLWKKNSSLGLGLHANITKGKSCLGLKSLVDENGEFRKINDFENYILNKDDVYNELKAQVEKLLSYGVFIDHLDCHHPIHANKTVREVTAKICKEYNFPIRSEHPLLVKFFRSEGILTTDVFCKNFSRENAKAETIIKFLDDNLDKESCEIMTHLGFMDDETKKRTTYQKRDKEIDELRKVKSLGYYKKFELNTFNSLFYRKKERGRFF